MSMSFGFRWSVIFHTVIFIIAVFGIPSLFEPEPLEETHAITVEVLPVSDLTNVKQKKAPKPKIKKKRPVITKNAPKIALPEPKTKPRLSKPEPVSKPKRKPDPKTKPEPAPVPKKPELKQEEKKEVKKEDKPAMNEDAFASVLKSVEEFRESEDAKEKEQEDEADFSEVEDFLSSVDEPKYKPGLPLSISEKDAIRQQIMKNWTVLSGAKNADMVVTLEISLARDGSVRDVTVSDTLKYSTNSFFRAMADSAVRAVYKSSPLKNLPAEKYDVKDGWRELELRFDPSEMLY